MCRVVCRLTSGGKPECLTCTFHEDCQYNSAYFSHNASFYRVSCQGASHKPSPWICNCFLDSSNLALGETGQSKRVDLAWSRKYTTEKNSLPPLFKLPCKAWLVGDSERWVAGQTGRLKCRLSNAFIPAERRDWIGPVPQIPDFCAFHLVNAVWMG